MNKARKCSKSETGQTCSFIGPEGYRTGATVACYRCGRKAKVGHPVAPAASHFTRRGY